MKCLILTDLQNDFLPGGALPVPRGDEVIPLANRLGRHFELIVATQDWHPPHHGSFASHHPGKKPGEVIELGGIPQVLWPDHCVQKTPGAEFSQDLDRSRIHRVFRKGTHPEIDSYSAFYDNLHRRSTGLGEFLKEKGVTEVYLLGLATNYCVKFSALDAVGLGFKTYVIEDACRGIELNRGDIKKAYREMEAAGIERVRSREIL
jgi:nicotinamidase/pyrazinamidase